MRFTNEGKMKQALAVYLALTGKVVEKRRLEKRGEVVESFRCELHAVRGCIF